MKSKSPEDIAVIGVDIGKDTFDLVGFDHAGERILGKKIKRLALNLTFEKLPRCVVGMKACMSAHIVSRMLRELGFEPRIVPFMLDPLVGIGTKKKPILALGVTKNTICC